MLPFVVENLICIVLVDEQHRLHAPKDFIREFAFLCVHRNIAVLINELCLEIRVKAIKGVGKSLYVPLHRLRPRYRLN